MDDADALAHRLGLHVRRGKALREAEAVRYDKGSALREILDRSGARSACFMGDDLTDFPAIELAAERGVGVFVRSEEQRGTPSGAALSLQSVDEVFAVLSGLLQSLSP
jgi:trehalose-6-phosphatase